MSESLAGEGRAAIYSVALELFEGPLDLLLHLVRRHELDILDIPIAFVAEKYLEYLHLMRSLDLEIAGDYLVMAATLAWLKSRELLPSQASEELAPGEDEEGEDPRAALIRRLVEYERFKSAASELDALPVAGRDVFARGADIDVPPMDPGLAPVTLFRLAEAYYRVLTRAKIARTHDVTIEAVTVAQRMQQLTLMLDERQEFEFEALFLSRTWHSESELRGMLVVTLMSVLELVKLGVARVQQVPDSTAIRVYRLVDGDEARRLVEGYDETESFGAPVEPGPPAPSEAELDAIEERTLLAEALAGLTGEEDEEEDAGDAVGADGPTAAVRELDAAHDATHDATVMAANEAGAEEVLAEALVVEPDGVAEAQEAAEPVFVEEAEVAEVAEAEEAEVAEAEEAEVAEAEEAEVEEAEVAEAEEAEVAEAEEAEIVAAEAEVAAAQVGAEASEAVAEAQDAAASDAREVGEDERAVEAEDAVVPFGDEDEEGP